MSVSPIFIDSNIWLYRFLADQDPDPQEDARKRRIAIALTDAESIIVSTQVIASLKRAVHLRMLYRLSFWDSLIVACAVQSDVPILYSEDMQHGLIVSEKLAIMNPFQ